MIRSGVEKKSLKAAKIRWTFIVFAILVVIFSVASKFVNFMPQMHGRSYLDVKDRVSVGIYYDGQDVKLGLPDSQWVANLGDRVQIELTLPEAAPFEDTYLCFCEYNCLTEFRINGELYNFPANGDHRNGTYTDYLRNELDRTYMIGNIQYLVPIPDYAWGKILSIELWPQEINNYTLDTYFYLMPASEVRYQPLMQHEAAFFIYIFAMVGSAFGVMVALLGPLFRKNTKELLQVSLFVLFISSWYLGRNHLLYMLFSNIRLCAKMEFYSLIATPMFISWYLAVINKSARVKKIFNWLGFTFLAIFLLLTLTMLVFHIPLCDTLYPFQLVSLVALLVALVVNVKGFFTNNEPSALILMGGMIITTFLLVVQILCIRGQGISGLPGWLRAVMDVDYVSWVLFVIILTVTISLVQRSAELAKERILQETLEALAYVDSLTGIPNRASLTEEMGKLTEEDGYAVIFLDVDRLKQANDVYGHETGDMLIRTGANALREAFNGASGFFGRWGGDEFVAFLTELEYAEGFRARLEDAIVMGTRAAGDRLPVPLQMSVGIVIHEPGDTRTTKQCLDEADKLMYEDKLRRRNGRAAADEPASPEGIEMTDAGASVTDAAGQTDEPAGPETAWQTDGETTDAAPDKMSML